MAEFLESIFEGQAAGLFYPPAANFYYEEEDSHVVMVDTDGDILSHNEWCQLRNLIDAFYRDTFPQEIVEHNQERALREEAHRQRWESLPPRVREKDGFVYVVSNGIHYKIGRSSNVEARVKSLRASTTHPLELLTFLPCPDMYASESYLHVRFHQYLVQNEWFALTAADLAWLQELTSEELVRLTMETPNDERFTSWQGLAKQLRRNTKTPSGLSG